MDLKRHNLLAVIGATATGKTSLAVALAKQFNGEVLSADSRQVYRGLDIGSGKDLHEYGDTPYHLIDIVSPQEEYNLFRFQQDFYAAFEDVSQRNKTPILSGGSLLYVDAVINGYEMQQVPVDDNWRSDADAMSDAALRDKLIAIQPNLHNSTDLNDRERLIRAIEIAQFQGSDRSDEKATQHPDIKPIIMCIDWPREARAERIKTRLIERLEEGMIDEVQQLHEQGVTWDKLVFFGLEYRFIAEYLQNKLNYNDMMQKLASAIRTFAKRQDNWLRKFEKQGAELHRLNPEQDVFTQAMNVIAARDHY